VGGSVLGRRFDHKDLGNVNQRSQTQHAPSGLHYQRRLTTFHGQCLKLSEDDAVRLEKPVTKTTTLGGPRSIPGMRSMARDRCGLGTKHNVVASQPHQVSAETDLGAL
jgi:hypothetical protein